VGAFEDIFPSKSQAYEEKTIVL